MSVLAGVGAGVVVPVLSAAGLGVLFSPQAAKARPKIQVAAIIAKRFITILLKITFYFKSF
ncbi:exported protein of unknown function [Legionella fallonii LLAP-10]|uniref:Uncharacterized protein n=1 Tax=Legionella fallonii LLAP-10 TaxID=1212491 RepID=A0A098G4D9_9GAMM|nr:exported protein of unknown function [Legionella fallonii LLAP-10]